MDVQRTMRRLRGRAQRYRFLAPAVPGIALRTRTAGVNRDVIVEDWDAVADGAHNSNTDLTHFAGSYWLCHQASPYHLGSRRSRLLLWRSRDGRAWEKVTEFKNETGREYRDPKFAQINGRLFLYVLPNNTIRALPVTTAYASSADGVTWEPMRDIEPRGWLFWRPKTRDGVTWYVTAYWHEHGRAALLRSNGGHAWTEVSRIHEGDACDETDFEFLPDGRMLATARLEGTADNRWGDRDAATLMATASPPYEQWEYTRSRITRLDGPCLFPYNGRVYAIARFQASRARRFAELGGSYSKKRTSLFAVGPQTLTYLCDLPSAGDTSYAGIVVNGDEAIASYYTTPSGDPPWAIAMFGRTDIRMARIDLAPMERLAVGLGAFR